MSSHNNDNHEDVSHTEDYYDPEEPKKPKDDMNVRLSKKAVRRESARRTSGLLMPYVPPEKPAVEKPKPKTRKAAAPVEKDTTDRDDTTTARWLDDDDDSVVLQPQKFWVEDKSQRELDEERALEEIEIRRKRQQERKFKGLLAALGCIVCALLAVIAWLLIKRFVLDNQSEAGSIGSNEDPLEKFDPRPPSLASSNDDSKDDNNNNSEDGFVCSGRVKLGSEVLTSTSFDREVAPDETVQYQCTFRNLWTAERQPVGFPTDQARWSGPILWTGPNDYVPFQEEGVVSPGAQSLIETGRTSTLVQEMNEHNVFAFVDNPGLPVGNNDDDYFVHLPPLEVNAQNPFLSLMGSMEPSPDDQRWFTGMYNFALLDDYNVNVRPQWKHHVKLQLYPWQLQRTIARRVTNARLPNGPSVPLKDPNGDWVPPVGELECFIVEDEANPLQMPDCDYYADPCCEEGTLVCDNLLPNGMLLPDLSCATQEVLFYRNQQN